MSRDITARREWDSACALAKGGSASNGGSSGGGLPPECCGVPTRGRSANVVGHWSGAWPIAGVYPAVVLDDGTDLSGACQSAAQHVGYISRRRPSATDRWSRALERRGRRTDFVYGRLIARQSAEARHRFMASGPHGQLDTVPARGWSLSSVVRVATKLSGASMWGACAASSMT
jgi:hypothetical protein